MIEVVVTAAMMVNLRSPLQTHNSPFEQCPECVLETAGMESVGIRWLITIITVVATTSIISLPCHGNHGVCDKRDFVDYSFHV